MTQNRNNLLSQRTPQTVTNIIHIITPFSDIGKLFTVTIHKNWHAIANDTTLHYLDIQTLISLYQIQQHSQPLCPCCTSIWLLMAGFLTPLPIYIHIYQYRHTHCDIVRVTYPQWLQSPLLPIRHTKLILVLQTTYLNIKTCYEDQGITQWLWDTPTRRLLCSLLRKLSHTLFITNLFGSNNIFLYNLCQHMAFSLWDFPANITLPPIPILTSIVTPSSHRVPPPRFPFSSHAPTSHTLILPCTHQIFFSIYSIWMLS